MIFIYTFSDFVESKLKRFLNSSSQLELISEKKVFWMQKRKTRNDIYFMNAFVILY